MSDQDPISAAEHRYDADAQGVEPAMVDSTTYLPPQVLDWLGRLGVKEVTVEELAELAQLIREVQADYEFHTPHIDRARELMADPKNAVDPVRIALYAARLEEVAGMLWKYHLLPLTDEQKRQVTQTLSEQLVVRG